MIILSLLLLFASFLYLDRAFEYMTFIGDHAWFYLSARDMIVGDQIPLVGITSSHTWLHQGAYWTYLISPFLTISNFHPGSPLLLTSILGLASIFLIYKLFSEFVSKRCAYITSTLFAFSPLVIFHIRNPYHTTPVIFFIILFMYSLLKFLRGNKFYLLLIFVIMAILYNFHLSTVIFWSIIIFYLIYGFLRKEKYTEGLTTIYFIGSALFAFLIPMMPILVYDFNNGFYQTFKYAGWLVLSATGIHDSGIKVPLSDLFSFFIARYELLILPLGKHISTIIFVLTIIFSFINLKKKDITSPSSAIILVTFIGVAAFFIAGAESEAYLVMLFPGLIMLLAFVLDSIKSNIMVIGLVVLFSIININYLQVTSYMTLNIVKMQDKLNAVEKIHKLSNGQEINLIYRGNGEQFESSKMPYEYLVWWKYGIDLNKKGVKILVNEGKDNIIVKRLDE